MLNEWNGFVRCREKFSRMDGYASPSRLSGSPSEMKAMKDNRIKPIRERYFPIWDPVEFYFI